MLDETPTVLIVDDEPEIRRTFTDYLQDVADVRAGDVDEALELIDDDVDIVLLDREMPSMSGEEFLELIRDEGYDCQVCMVTGVEPELEIVDMPFDDYLVKPASEDDLKTKLQQLLQRREYDEEVQELFALTSKRHVLGEGDTDVTESWRGKDIKALIEDAEVAPAPGVFGGWHSGTMAVREEREKEFAERLDRSPVPIVLEQVAGSDGDVTAQSFPAGAASLTDVGDRQGDTVVLDYGQLREVVRVLALGFDAMGVDHGDPVLICTGPRAESAWCDLAVQVLGAPVVTVAPDAPDEQLRRCVEVGPEVCVVEDEAARQRVEDAVVDANADVSDDFDNPEIRREIVDTNVRQFVVLDDTDADDPVTLKRLHETARQSTSADRYVSLLEDLSLDDPVGVHVPPDSTPQTLTHRHLIENAGQVYARLAAGEDGLSLDAGSRLVTGLSPASPATRVVNHVLATLYAGTVDYASTDAIVETTRRTDPAVLALSADHVSSLVEDALASAGDAALGGRGALEWALGVSYDYRRTDDPGIGDRVQMWLASQVGVEEFADALGGVEGVLCFSGPISGDDAEQFLGGGVRPINCFTPDRVGVCVAATPPEESRFDAAGVPMYDENVDLRDERDVENGQRGELLIKGPNVPTDAFGGGSLPLTDSGHLRTGEQVTWDDDDYLIQHS